MKHTAAHLGGHDPWEIEISIWIKERGVSPEKARVFTILRWMYNEDLRPLVAAIWKGDVIDEAVLNCLATMIDEGRIGFKRNKPGRPRPPDTFARDYIAKRLYEAEIATGKSSEQAFHDVARQLPATVESVRKAVSRVRKTSKK
jgi:hypothetical protein